MVPPHNQGVCGLDGPHLTNIILRLGNFHEMHMWLAKRLFHGMHVLVEKYTQNIIWQPLQIMNI